MSEKIDPQLLRQLLTYEPETGKLFWLPRPPHLIGAGRSGSKIEALRFNTKWAGKPALNSPTKAGYRAGVVCGKSMFAHRAAWAIHHGKMPQMWLDHVNGDREDNRLDNLREVDASQNAQNSGRRKDNKTGCTGIYWRQSISKWQASIRVDGRIKGLGCFAHFDDAVTARRNAESFYGFHPNHGRAAA